MKFENTQVMNFKNALRGLRNPMNSWTRSDSWGGIVTVEQDCHLEDTAKLWLQRENQLREKQGKAAFKLYSEAYDEVLEKWINWLYSQGCLQTDQCHDCLEAFYFGPKDLDLAQRMIKAGTSDRKFLRQIMVSVDITGPLYWWKEFDTYKVSTVANSTSTMHKLTSTPITIDCFETDDFIENQLFYKNNPHNPDMFFSEYWQMLINDLEHLRKEYIKTKDKKYQKQLIRLLPEAWLQTRTVTMNYEVLTNIYSQRKNHKLSEWHQFCDWVKTLPYSYELITFNIDK